MTKGPASKSRTKLVYIVSSGHSGSTLLDFVTGTIPGGASLGECAYFPWQLSRGESAGPGASPQKLCSCGAGFHECDFWVPVVRKLSERAGFDVFENPLRFRMNLLQSESLHEQRWSQARILRAAVSVAHASAVAYPVAGLIERSFETAVANNWMYFDTTAEVSGRSFLVDSSKSALRLKLLHAARPDAVSALILFRDIRGVAHSRNKLGEDPVAAAAGWVQQYNRIWNVLRRIPGLRFACVRYEDMVENPPATRQRIAEFLGLSVGLDPVEIDTYKCHTVAGNQLRSKGRIQIRADMSWAEGLSPTVLDRIDRIRETLNPAWEEHIAPVSP